MFFYFLKFIFNIKQSKIKKKIKKIKIFFKHKNKNKNKDILYIKKKLSI
jgi:hypothetical protein